MQFDIASMTLLLLPSMSGNVSIESVVAGHALRLSLGMSTYTSLTSFKKVHLQRRYCMKLIPSTSRQCLLLCVMKCLSTALNPGAFVNLIPRTLFSYNGLTISAKFIVK